MWGTIVNTIAIVAGGLLGTFLKRGMTKKTLKNSYSSIIMQGIGLATLIIGITNAIKTENMLLVIMSLVIGGIIGEAVGIERRLDGLGSVAQKHIGGGEGNTVAEGFISASLIFCVGAMAIVGALDAGINGDYLTLYAKSTLDGITSIILASTLGIGVVLSAGMVLIYQGGITLLSGVLQPYLSPMVINEMSAVGGILILGIGLSILGIKKINVGNMLPAIFIPAIYFPLAKLVSTLIHLIK